jgi:hypothetical protein
MTTDRYLALLDLTRRQRELIESEEWAAAAALGVEWQELVDALPLQPPAEAREILAEAAALAWSNTATLEVLVAGVTEELEHVGRGRRALTSYAGAFDSSLDAIA